MPDPTPKPKPDRSDLALALLKVFGANLVSPVAPGVADRWTQGVIDDFAAEGGDPAEHATLFGLAGAGGDVGANVAIMQGGALATRAAVQAARNQALLRSLLRPSPPGQVPVGMNPLEFIRPELAERAAGAAASTIPQAGRVVGSIKPVATKAAGRIAAGTIPLIPATDRR